MDIFNEKLIKRQKSVLDIAIILLVVIGAIIACILLMMFVPGYLLLLPPAVIYLAYFVITRRNIEYEYALTNGDLDIDIIINQKKRKRVFSSNCKEFEMVAKVKSNHYTNDIRESKDMKDYTSHSEQAEVWFISMRQDGKPTVILFEPNQKMIESFAVFIPRKVFR